MKRILFLLALILFISSCKEKNTFIVNGTIQEQTKGYIYFNHLDLDTPVLIDSSKINKKGEFSFRIKSSGADFYQLSFSKSDFITLLAEPGEKIEIVFSGPNLFENYSISGSKGSEALQILDQQLNETKRKLDSLSNIYSEISKEPQFEIKGAALETEFNTLVKDQRKKNIEFIISNTNSLASIKALYQRINPETYVLYDPHDLQYLKIVTDSLTKYYPNSKHVQALARDFDKEMNQMIVNQIGKVTKNLPETKLDPNLEDINGKRIALSSLRGKYVLLTFWSIRSKESIAENFQLKEFYKIYKKKGFEIYQISLDISKEDWKASVRFDELPWISTREDDPLNPKNALLFNVKNLPANYLFDKEGSIIGSNLHGKTLKLKLDQLFNK
jgi:hypothetical protein